MDVGVVRAGEDVMGRDGQACYRLDVARWRGDLPAGGYLDGCQDENGKMRLARERMSRG